jgi:phospholipase/carboxylesterase
MNRIAFAAEDISVPTSLVGSHGLIGVANVASRRAKRVSSDPCATFAPIHYEPGYAYPLIVWLHSTASSERELRHVMPLLSMRNYVAIAPRAMSLSSRHRNKYSWRQTGDDIEAAETRVAECIAAASRRYNIHPSKIFLAGCGGGGTMALRLAWNDPGRFAGVVAINGALPTRWQPLRRVNEARQVPCLLAASRDNRAYPAEQMCSDLRLLHSAGCTVALRQYPGADDLTSNMLSDMNRWLMELVCGGARCDS